MRVRSLVSLLLGLSIAASAFAGPKLPDLSEQFLFGFEPTRTNIRMLLDSAYAVVKKAVTGRGKGVLEIEAPTNRAVRAKYLELLRQSCPECAVSEIRESHGTISYRVTYPDGYYIGSSLDAGALEWQTRPSTYGEIVANRTRSQTHLFDLPERAGATRLLDALGGHVTESGYDDPLFWLASLELDAETPEMAWGFFGKDGYNATPVKMWAADQQAEYRRVALEQKQQWKKFIGDVEALYANGNPTTDQLRAAFVKRQIADRKTLVGKLAGIYYNPKQESKLTGKRSKPKYVAQRPGIAGDDVLLIESRAIRPQKEAKELELLAKYRLRRAEYIKTLLDQGLEPNFRPGQFAGLSANDTAAQAKVFIEELGLRWDEYSTFSPVKDPRPTGREKKLAGFFEKSEYGVARRDRAFAKVLDSFYAKAAWTTEEWDFVMTLTEERANTVPLLKQELSRIGDRMRAGSFTSLPPEDLERLLGRVRKIVGKYRAPAKRLYATTVKTALDQVYETLWRANRLGELKNWLPYLLDSSLREWSSRAAALLGSAPGSVSLELQAEIIGEFETRGFAADDLVEGWYAALAKTPPDRLSGVPRSLAEMDSRLAENSPLRKAAYGNLATAIERFPPEAMRESDGALLHLVAAAVPEREAAIFRPYRKRLLAELEKLEYGMTEYYRAIVLSDLLVAATPASEREATLNDLMTKVKAMHARRNDADSKSFVERIENQMKTARVDVCASKVGSTFLARLRAYVLGLFAR